MNKAIVILSGGLDSTTLLYDVISQGYEVEAISFNYNQKHKCELEKASATCKKLNIPHKIANIEVLNDLVPSALTRSNWDIPEGHYEGENMKQTVVNNRNPVMANLALAYALSIKANKIFLGIHAGDHRIYEDCREQALNALNETAYIWSSDNRGRLTPNWIASFFEAQGCFSHNNYRQMVIPTVIITQKDKSLLQEIKKFFYERGSISQQKSGCYDYRLQHQDCRLVINLMKTYGFQTKHKKEQFNKWYNQFHEMFEREVETDNPAIGGKTYEVQIITFEAPYLFKTKGDIVKKGLELGVDYSLTQTCYNGRERACGKCSSCQERLEAFTQNNAIDPIDYEPFVAKVK